MAYQSVLVEVVEPLAHLLQDGRHRALVQGLAPRVWLGGGPSWSGAAPLAPHGLRGGEAYLGAAV